METREGLALWWIQKYLMDRGIPVVVPARNNGMKFNEVNSIPAISRDLIIP